MPEVRRRRTTTKPPVSRRRDRVEEEEDLEEEDDVDATQTAAPAKRASRVTDEEPEEDDADLEDEDEETPPPRKSASAKKRRPAPVEDEDEDEDEDDEPAPRRSRASKPKLPPGIKVGRKGAQEIRKAGGGGAERLVLGNEPVLVKVLENEPFVSYRQHWIESGPGQANRPYTCMGPDCPLCELGDRSSASTAYNVLLLSEDGGPVNKIMQIGVKADKAFEDAATDPKTGTISLIKGYWAISKSGKGQQTQTNFRPVKDRDLEDDWPEVLDEVDFGDLPAVIEDATEKCFDHTIIQTNTRKQLLDVAKYMAED